MCVWCGFCSCLSAAGQGKCKAGLGVRGRGRGAGKRKLFSHWLNLERGWEPTDCSADEAVCVRSPKGVTAAPKVGAPRPAGGQCCQNDLLCPLLSCPGSRLRTSKTRLNTVIWPHPLPRLQKGVSPKGAQKSRAPGFYHTLHSWQKWINDICMSRAYPSLCFVLGKVYLFTFLIKRLKSIFWSSHCDSAS